MSGRFRTDAKSIFDVFIEVVGPREDRSEPWILQTYPHSYNKDSCKSVPQFVYPCELEITTVQNFSFVLTKDDAKWTFGFCRLSPDAETALVILSSLPWHETFYKILNYAAELMHRQDGGDLFLFLESCLESRIPEPESNFLVSWGPGPIKKDFTCKTPNHLDLPSIPENRNLTEYYNAVGIQSMLVIFASMLYERRVIIVSRKLSRLSACVQAANAIIYPMQWQHIYIPILSKQLMDYLSAPMPFLIGVPTPIYERVRKNEIGDAVILDADENRIQTPFMDLESLPVDVSNNLKKSLKNHKDLLGDSVARAFLHALVHLIGGYRDALKFRPNEKITFDEESFIRSRSPNLQPFLEQMLHLQIFQQFIEERLNLLNAGQGISDEFEKEAVCFTEKSGSNSKIKAQYSQISSSVKKEGGALVKAVRNKANPAVKQAVRSVKDGSKTAYKEFKSRIREGPGSSTVGGYRSSRGKELHRTNSCSSAPSSPTLKRNNRSLSIASVESGNSAASTTGLPSLTRNNTDLNLHTGRILKYERFDPPSISSFENEKSPEMEGPPPLDLDLMNDLQDVIFKRKDDAGEPPAINRQLKPLLRRAPPPAVILSDNAEFEVARFNSNSICRQQSHQPLSRATTRTTTTMTTTMLTNKYNNSYNKNIASKALSNNPFYNNGNIPMPIAPPRSKRNVSPHAASVERDKNERKSSVGDLINLTSNENSPESPNEIIFDPLLETSKTKNASLSNTGLRVRPSTNPFSGETKSTTNGDFKQFISSMNAPSTLSMQKSTTSASSDDLLQEYGIDFEKMSLAKRQGGTDLLLDLDPLSSSKSQQSSIDTWGNNQQAPPIAPPRSVNRKQNWTTFD